MKTIKFYKNSTLLCRLCNCPGRKCKYVAQPLEYTGSQGFACGYDVFEDGRWYSIKLCPKFDVACMREWGVENLKRISMEEAALFEVANRK